MGPPRPNSRRPEGPRRRSGGSRRAQSPAPEEIVRLAAERNVPIHKVTRERLDALSDHHQGLVGDAVPYAYADFDDILASLAAAPPERPPLIVVLDSLQDPQNLGTLLRS